MAKDWELHYAKAFETRIEALAHEDFLKRKKSKAFLREMIAKEQPK